MGKKGKKKGKNEEESTEGGPSQPAAPQAPQQQQQQQNQPQQQQQQRRDTSVGQAAEGVGQLSLDDGGRQHYGDGGGRGGRRGGHEGHSGRGRGGQDGHAGRGRGGQDGNAGRGRGGYDGNAGRGRGGQDGNAGRGRGGYDGNAGRGRDAPQGSGRGQRPPFPGLQAPAQAPGMAQPPQGGRPAAWGAQAQPQAPGMAQPPQRAAPAAGQAPVQAHIPGMPAPRGPQRAPSPARSTASSAAGDTASVKSSGSGKKTSPQAQPGLGASPVKTSLSAELQATYVNQIPKRKNPNKGGTAGRPITVETNMIPIIFGKNFQTWITHYDVKLDPDKPRFMYRPVVEAVRLKHYPKRFPVFDGRCNVFSAGQLPFGEHLTTEIEVENPQRQKTMSFKVTFTKAQDIDMSWLPNVKPGFQETERSQIAIQALDVVLRAAPLRQRAVPVGRSFFTPPAGRPVDLGNGMDLWIGTFQSAVLGWKPYFNIDVAHKAFPRNQPVIHLINELCGDSRSQQPATARDIDYNRKKLADYLKGLKVTYEIPGHPTSKRTMGINDLGKNSREATFQLQDGSVTTVENYFAREKRYKIRYPDFPTLWVGSRQKTVLIPAELCIIEAGQVTNKKMDERQTSTMIKFAATNTDTRKQKILDGFSKMRSNEDASMKEFGISVGGGFETVKARVLNPPALFDKQNISVRKGVWRANSFHTASTLDDRSWTILNLNDRTQEGPLRNLVQLLKNGGRQVGMNIGEPLTPFKNMRAPMRDVREIVQFFNEKKKEGLKLIIVVVPDKTGPVYGKVKQVAELTVGVLTQCLKAVTVERKMNDATAGNILLKINSKLNGTNQIFTPGKNPPCLNKPCMIVGADVTHPSPDAVGIPSIAAVAASHGPRAFRYNVQIRLQPPKTEIILHLEEIMKEQLIFFYKNTGHKPERIIFYRDGVSEGQFPQVMHHELQAIRNACRRLGGATKYEPLITFLVVQKRHHIRLFPTDMRNSDDRNGNVQAGTVVDTEITHPSHIDFYLVSHASIQGTARPTKYRCLWDDSDMSEDEIEQLTYYLCHMFSRCTRSVSYPAPTYYAHLAAFRARALTNEVDIRLNNLEEEQRTKMTIKDEILKNNPMFFV